MRAKMTGLFDLGKPRPRVAWFLESQIIDAPSEIRETQGPAGETNVVTISNVTLHGLTRSHYHAKLFCKASNTHLAPPPTTAVIIELHSKWIRCLPIPLIIPYRLSLYLKGKEKFLSVHCRRSKFTFILSSIAQYFLFVNREITRTMPHCN